MRPDQVRICVAIFPFTLTSCIHYMLEAVAASPSNIDISVNSFSSAKSTKFIFSMASSAYKIIFVQWFRLMQSDT